MLMSGSCVYHWGNGNIINGVCKGLFGIVSSSSSQTNADEQG